MQWLKNLFTLPRLGDLHVGQTVKLYDGRTVKVDDPSPRGSHSSVFGADDGNVYSREDIAR